MLNESWFSYAMVALLGAAMGSFISLISYRMARDEPWVAVRSKCPVCGTALGWKDLFPIVSYVLSTGKCRHCGTAVSWRYPLTEIITALAFVWTYYTFSATAEGIIIALLIVCIITLIITDLEHYMIPDEIQIASGALAIAYAIVMERDLPHLLLSGLAGGAFGLIMLYGFLWIKGRHGLGMGDVKFFVVAGLWLGMEAFLPFLFYSGVLGIVSAMIWRLLGKGEHFPFGPAIAISMLLCILYPEIPMAFWQIDRLILP